MSCASAAVRFDFDKERRASACAVSVRVSSPNAEAVGGGFQLTLEHFDIAAIEFDGALVTDDVHIGLNGIEECRLLHALQGFAARQHTELRLIGRIHCASACKDVLAECYGTRIGLNVAIGFDAAVEGRFRMRCAVSTLRLHGRAPARKCL